MSPRRTRAGSGSAVSTRSKRKINNMDEEDTAELIQQTRESQRKPLERTAKQSARKKSPDTKVMLRKSAKKKIRRKLNLTQEAENEDNFTAQKQTMDITGSIKILRDRHKKTSLTEHNLSQLNTSKDLDSNKKLDKKVQRKTGVTDVKNSINVTPKSTPPKLSLTPHRSKKTPKKSPISLGSPKTHSIAVSKLFKSPRKLSLLTKSEENLNKSDKSQNEKEKTKKDRLNNSSTSNKSLTPPVAQSNLKAPKSTPPKLSLTPHRSKKTPKKSPISLGSPKTHSIAVSKLFKSPRKLSLLTKSEENLNKSDKSQNEKEKTKKDRLNNSSTSNKSLTPLVAQSKHRKSGINLKAMVRKFSKSPKIVLRSPKSKKSKSRKLKLLSPSQKVRKNSLKTSANITSDTTPNFDVAKSNISTKKSPKEKNLSRSNHQLIKTRTISQEKDMLTEPIVLLKRLSPERIQNMSMVANKIQPETSITKRSPSINTRNNFKVLTTSAGSDMSVNRNSNTKSQNSNAEKLKINRVSPRIKHNILIQRKDGSSIPLISSTPREKTREIPSIDINLTFNTPIINEDNTSSIKSRRKNQSNMSNVMHKSTAIENISTPSLFENTSDASQFHISNVTKQDTIEKEFSLITPEKNQKNEKRNTYELEQPQTLSLRQMIKKRTSTDANLSSRENLKKTKVHFADETFNTSNVNKSINNLSGSNISHNVKIQNNINSAHKSRKIETPKLNQNSLVFPFKTRSSPRTNIVTPRIQLNKVTPKSFTLMENKSEKKSSTKKVPNFGKIHEQMFAKSESLVDAKKRVEARHLALSAKKVRPKLDTKKEEKKPLPTDTKDGTHNRFGFKLRKNEATHVILRKQVTFSRQKQQQETRMTLKGVRMNRRFELQMKARNLNP
ncbi:rho GTPase-activating protein gacF [Nylanderia fulva]|uniref:rho GTPase-activating protein gacF n=1 Tax=Nylanderia fulva TaxID=613905 RepID=UPI0010FB3A2C|nr:rho GTPase-activating protein gacF [Nylanderia fulva]